MQRAGLGGAVRHRADRALQDKTGNRGDNNDGLEVRLVEQRDKRHGGEVDAVDVD